MPLPLDPRLDEHLAVEAGAADLLAMKLGTEPRKACSFWSITATRGRAVPAPGPNRNPPGDSP